MNCPPFDLRDYFLGELPPADSAAVERHLSGCAGCREELDAWRATHSALLNLRDEEIPQRIAFISDKVFEPSGWRRALAAFWGSAARLGFVSAMALSAALLVATLQRPAPPAPAASVNAAPPKLEEITAALESAVARSEAKTAALLQDAEKRQDLERRANLVAFQESLAMLQKRLNVVYLANANSGVAR